ncbi:hypothetical protein RJ639_029142 [Escallonia herrerae]|uniref:Uncharacterized protein n=1 Tax=Escallonia herrerae TaxID=1293975 RepID=A0AA89BH36_9ASTE|nr:hypothetical protein RJ639_029142 [Escallonia herrerae]
MDIHKSEGLSWADQWDPEPLQPASTDDDKKEGKDGSGKNKSGKKILSLKRACASGSSNSFDLRASLTIKRKLGRKLARLCNLGSVASSGAISLMKLHRFPFVFRTEVHGITVYSQGPNVQRGPTTEGSGTAW